MIDHWIMFVVFGFELGSVQDALKKCFNQQYLGNSGLILIAHDITGRPLTRDAVEIEHPKHPVLAQFNWITKIGYICLCKEKAGDVRKCS